MLCNLLDNNFSHHLSVNVPDCSVAGQKSEFIEWNRNNIDKNLPTFYTHQRMLEINTPKEISYGWLFESRAFPMGYKNIESVINKFKTIFTHNSELLFKYNNTRWIPGGGIWVGGTYGKGSVGIKPKNKICSIVSSNKSMCELHKFRTQTVRRFQNHPKITSFDRAWIPIHNTLDNFMFSIIIENFIDDLYFTEKILNCFATGTIPIYLGASNISSKFNSEGILTFNTLNELDKIVNKLSIEQYNEKIDAIKDNFNRAKEYRTIEDYMYINYLKK